MKIISIAIDGPAGAGKSTIAKNVAKKLDINYVDTGAMYRTVAYYCLLKNINPKDKERLLRCLEDIDIYVNYINNEQKMILNGKDVTTDIRTQEVSNAASAVAVYKEVREKLVNIQRDIAKRTSVIMDGRDIGTYVLPNADLKIYLTADSRKRAERRYIELKEKGENPNFDTIKKEIEERDFRDMNREYAPLKKAHDAITVDTTHLNIDEVINKVLDLVKSHIKAN